MKFFLRSGERWSGSPPRRGNWQAQRAPLSAKFLAVFMRFRQERRSVSRTCQDPPRGLRARRTGMAHGALLAASCALSGCGAGELPDTGAPALLHSKMASTASSIAEASWMHLPVPPADGPKLYPLSLATRVRAAPTP